MEINMHNKSGELINYPAGNLLAHFNRYSYKKLKLKRHIIVEDYNE